MWHWWNILGILRVSNGSPTGSPQTYRPTRPTRLHIRNLLDRKFGTIFLYNNDSFTISILLHRQNLNLVIFGWTELLILKDFVIWCKNRCWHWHEQISLVHMPLVSHHHQSVTQTVRWGSIEVQERSSQQRVCCCVDRKAEAWIKVSSLWDPTEPHWGERTHTQQEHREAQISGGLDCPVIFTIMHMGPPSCWLTGFR